MIALLLIFFLVIWGGVCCLLGWLMLNLFPKKLQNKLYIAPFALILFVLPVIDEILGSFQFANLCKELPTVEFNQENNISNMVYLEETGVELKGSFVPVVQSNRVSKDVNSKKEVISSLSYSAKGGRLARKMGFLKPILFRGSCSNGRNAKKTLDSFGIGIDSSKKVLIDLRDKK